MAMSKELIPLTDSDMAYNKALARYVELSKEAEITIDFLEKEFVVYLERMRSEIERDGVIYYCGIGIGTGVKDIALLKVLRHLYPTYPIDMTIIEPNDKSVQAFLEQLKNDNLHDHINVTWYKALAHDVRRRQANFQESSFHVIGVMESLHYEPYLQEALQFYVCHLKGPLSTLLITHGYSLSGWNTINRDFAVEFGTHFFLGSEEINNKLQNMSGVCCFEVKVRENPYPIDEVFDELSLSGSHSLDFISHIVDFRQTASAELKARFLKRLQDTDVSRQSESGKWFFDMSFTTFTVQLMTTTS